MAGTVQHHITLKGTHDMNGQSHRDRILENLRAHPEGMDDDEIASDLHINPRQQVNAICRRLVTEGIATRAVDPRKGKIVTRLSRA